MTAIYTAFLLAQAKGRDLWQSATGSLQMFTHSVVAGAAVVSLLNPPALALTQVILAAGLIAELTLLVLEVATPHGSADAALAIKIMTRGPLARTFYAGALGGGLLPLIMVLAGGPLLVLPAAILALAGVLLTSHCWLQAPQRVPLS